MIYFGGLTALTAISVDIVLPATGVVARDFGTRESLGALLVGSYFIAYAVGQLFWGVFSDAFGRKRALVVSLGLFTLASAACALAPGFGFLVAMRAVQGLVGGTPVIARAMVRDVTHGNQAARILAVLSAILTIATLIAPVIGSGLLVLFEWQAMFWALALMGLAFLAYTLVFIDETAGQRRPERFSLRFVVQASRKLLAMPAFLVPMAFGSLSFAGYAAILSVGAVLTETVYAVAPTAFGSLFALAALSNTAGAMLLRRMLRGVQAPRMAMMSVAFLGLAGAVSLVSAVVTPSLPVFWGVVCLYVMAFGMVLPISIALAMDPAGEMPGFATSLMGAAQMGGGAVGAGLATLLFDGTHRAIPVTMALFAALAVLVLFLGRRVLTAS